MNSLLFDILGALIGFATVMLLLSMIVTALVQATQSLLRLRGRNLLFGLTTILQQEAKMSWQDAKDGAREILNDDHAPVLRGHIDPMKPLGKVMGPQVSWLEPEQLEEILKSCPLDLGPEVSTHVKERFARLDNMLRKRFLRNIRLWTLIWALPVAFYFQLSAPTVLSDFLNNPEMRAQAEQMATAVQPQVEASLGAKPIDEQASAEALKQLADKHPDLQDVIKAAGSAGQSKAASVDKLVLALSDHAQKAALVSEYEKLFDEIYKAQSDAARAAIGAHVADLTRINIEPWREEWKFYVRDNVPQWRNWVGVLVTMILLSFGAPFWFNALRKLMNLRDTLKPLRKDEPLST